MRKYLLAGVATLGAAGFAGAAFAQAPAAPPSPTEGTLVTAPSGGPSYANNNNNYQAAQLPGPVANPTPGTIVIHINGKVVVEGWGLWQTGDNGTFHGAPSPTSLAGLAGGSGGGFSKVQPQAIGSFARLYFGGDAMATNGLRYGAAIEIRENFSGQPDSNTSSGASGYSSLETLYVRRAFVYAAGANWGIIRAGQADGLIGIFDNGVTTFQFLNSGNLNGGDLEGAANNGSAPPFFFLGQAGNEYANTKFVYLSPQIAGFDFGFQYAPNTSNGEGINSTAGGVTNSLVGAGIGTGLACGTATTGCPSLSAGPGSQDGSRALNQTAVGVRYQGVLGGVGILAYGVWMVSGHADYTGPGVNTAAGLANLGAAGVRAVGGQFNGQYDGLNLGSGGLALTYAGFTVGGNVIGGRVNGQLGLVPKGGAHETAELVGAKYVTGPWTIGIVAERGDYQGNPLLAGLTQRRGRAIDGGVQYQVAPGMAVWAEYMYQDVWQGGAGGQGTVNVKSQGFLLGDVVNF
ncbi:MAG TPA: hypothetical protein VKT26_00150 [Acetobacteraceae bacterium]|nr:hypothetical protein [Acetobacteraceae bacterium]